MCSLHWNFTAAAVLALAAFLHKTPTLYKAVSPVTEGFWLVGELERRLSVEGMEAAGALLVLCWAQLNNLSKTNIYPVKGCE